MVEALRERETIAKEIQTAVRHTAVYGLGGLLGKAIGFLMLPFYTHYLTPTDYGILEILDLSMSLLGMFLNMGITAALLRCYAAAKSAQEQRDAVSTAFLFVAVTGAITFVLALGLVRQASTWLFGPQVSSTYLLVSVSSFILSYIANLPRTYLRALEASVAFVTVELSGLFVILALNIYFIAVLKTGLIGILLSSVISFSIQLVLLSAWTLRRVGIGFNTALLRQMVGFGLPLILSNLALFTLNFADRFFLQHLRSLEVVGIYAVGYKFGFMMNYLVVQPFYAMWQSRMYVIHARPDHAKVFSQMFMLYSLLLIYAGLALSIFSPEIVRIMVSSKFRASQDVIPVVAFAYIFYGISYYTQVGMFLTSNTQLVGMVSTFAAALNLVLNYFLILHYGMLGAAWATLLSFLAVAVGSYYFSQRVLPLSLGVGRVTQAIAIGTIFYFFSRWCSPEWWLSALIIKGVLLAMFPFVLWKARILSAEEASTLRSTRDRTFAEVSRVIAAISGRAVSL